ncbi:hypothetical protein [Streptomyces sp. NPDC058644]|uniref:hypothetical protein n=1 Tax=unclassified Streptomyces TaxID=2593676 RepID=UPI003656D1C5
MLHLQKRSRQTSTPKTTRTEESAGATASSLAPVARGGSHGVGWLTGVVVIGDRFGPATERPVLAGPCAEYGRGLGAVQAIDHAGHAPCELAGNGADSPEAREMRVIAESLVNLLDWITALKRAASDAKSAASAPEDARFN